MWLQKEDDVNKPKGENMNKGGNKIERDIKYDQVEENATKSEQEGDTVNKAEQNQDGKNLNKLELQEGGGVLNKNELEDCKNKTEEREDITAQQQDVKMHKQEDEERKVKDETNKVRQKDDVKTQNHEEDLSKNEVKLKMKPKDENIKRGGDVNKLTNPIERLYLPTNIIEKFPLQEKGDGPKEIVKKENKTETKTIVLFGKKITIKTTNARMNTKTCCPDLLRAAIIGHTPCVDLFLEQGADVNVVGKNGETPVINSARNGHHQIIKALIQAGADVNVKDNANNSGLLLAAVYGFKQCVNILIEAGAHVNVSNNSHNTALFCSTRNDHYVCADVLIKGGADVNIADRIGSTPLIIMVKKYQESFVSKTTKCEADINEQSRGKEELDIVKSLIKAGADVNIQNKLGEIALFTVMETKQFDVVKLLIEAGADVNVQIEGGESALMKATKAKQFDMFKLLLKSGADVNIVTTNGDSALSTAINCWAGLKYVHRLLLSGAYVNNSKLKIGLMDSPTRILLYAAGERTLEKFIHSTHRTHQNALSEEDLTSVPVLSLKEECRKTIRNQLFHAIPRGNLFLRAPKLGLPSLLVSYVLYDVSYKLEE